MLLRVVRRLRRFVRFFWSSCAIVLVILAILVTLGRKALPLLNDHKDEVAAELSQRLGVQVHIGSIEAAWRGLRPRLKLRHVDAETLQGIQIVSADTIDTQIDLPSLLWDWRLAFRKLQFAGLKTTFVQSEEGRWTVNGLPFSNAKRNNFSIHDPLDIFLFGRRIQLEDAHFTLNFRTGHSTQITLPTISLENDDDFHRLAAAFSVDKDQKALSFVVEGRGDPRDEDRFNAKGYLQLERFPMEKVVAATALAAWQHLDSGRWSDGSRIDLKLWFDGNPAKGFNLNGQFSADELPLKLPQGMILPRHTHANLFGSWKSEDGWKLGFGQLQFDWPDMSSPPVNLAIGGKLGEPLVLDVDSIDLASWSQIAQKAGASHPVLEALKPEGTLTGVKMRFTSAEEGYVDLRANVHQLGVYSFKGSPEILKVDGYLATTGLGGTLDLDSQQGFSMHYPAVYHDPLEYHSAKGQLRWALDQNNHQVLVSSSRLSLRGDDGDAEGHLYLELPTLKTPTAEPLMFLAVGLKHSTAAYYKKYVPFTAPEQLLGWLDKSIKGGNLLDGGFIYRGSLLKQPLSSRSIQLYLNVEDGAVDFDAHWPGLTQASAQLLMDDADLNVNLTSAQLMGNTITDTHVKLVRDDGLGLAISGDMAGDSKNALNLLRQSPVNDVIGEGLAQLRLTGPLLGHVDLRVPLVAGGRNSQAVDVALTQNNLTLPGLKLDFEGLSGSLRYNSDKGLSSTGIDAHLWGNPVSATIGLQQDGMTAVAFKGPVAVSSLQRWLQRPELNYAKGQALVVGTLLLPNPRQPGSVSLNVESDLKGVSFDLPVPFAKTAKDTLAFKGQISVDKSQQQDHYHFQFGDLADLNFNRNSQGLLALNLRLAEAQPKPLTPGKILVDAQLPAADLKLWQPFIMGYVALANSQPSAPDASPSLPLDIQVRLGSGSWGEMSWQPLSLSAEQKTTGWQFGFNTQMAAGNLQLNALQQPERLHLDYLNLPDDGQRKNDDGKCTPYNTSGANQLAPSQLADFNPALLPSLKVNIQKIAIGSQHFGQLAFNLEPMPDGVTVKDIQGQAYGMTLEGFNYPAARLVWTRTASGHYTAFDGRLRAANLADVLHQMDESESISSTSALFSNHLSWPGTPDQGAMANMSGFIQMDIQTGRFKQGASAGNNPLLKLISFLNFDNLGRRLRFDFADLNPQGMAFDSVQGRLDLNAGELHIEQPLHVSSASTHIQLAGDITVATQQVNANLVATLPLSGNLTLAAAMTGALPVAAGVYLAGKVFKKQMDKASSLRYRVKGPWVDPEMSLQSIFDDNTEQEIQTKPIKPLPAKKKP